MSNLGFGVDVTPDFETIAQAERLPDGTEHITAVILDRTPGGNA